MPCMSRSEAANIQMRSYFTVLAVPAFWRLVADHRGDTFRTVYTVRLAGRVYVLHAFQKKSKSGIRTPKFEIDLLKARLKRAQQEHADSVRHG
jgi:phage-related protein